VSPEALKTSATADADCFVTAGAHHRELEHLAEALAILLAAWWRMQVANQHLVTNWQSSDLSKRGSGR
jgi:hypothetical protein